MVVALALAVAWLRRARRTSAEKLRSSLRAICCSCSTTVLGTTAEIIWVARTSLIRDINTEATGQRCTLIHPVCSKVTFDANGHPVVVITSPTTVGLEVGTVFRLLGNTVLTTVSGSERLFAWQGRSGRPPTPSEAAKTRAPYQPARSRREREHANHDDIDISDEQAIEFCRREQERLPVDLIGRAT